MSKHLTVVNTEAEAIEAQKNLEEPFVVLVKDDNELIYQDNSHCDAVVLVDDWNNYHTELPVIQKDISWIKGRRCLVKKTKKGVAICYLDENNSELFHDGKTTAKLDGSMGQWMTDLPEFNIQCTEGGSDWIKLHISHDQEIGHKSRRVLLGVTKAVNRDGKLWSCKYPLGTTDTNYCTQGLAPTIFHNYANALGDGFDIVDYESHCKVAYMFMAKYKSKDPYSMEQFQHNAYPGYNVVGTTSKLGNIDSHTNTQVAIFGTEDWYANISECMGGIHCNNTSSGGVVYYIYDGFEPDKIPTVPYRTVNMDYISLTQSGYISRMEWGDYADLIPIEFSGSSKYFYPDYGQVGKQGWSIIRRPGRYDDYRSLPNGLFYFADEQNVTLTYISARIQYRGEIEVIDDPQEFISLPVGF